MIRTWIDTNGSDNIPAHLADLANRARVDLSAIVATPRRRDKRDKSHPSTPTGADGAREGVLKGHRFVLTGVWPFQGGGSGLTLGKERVKLCIEKFGGSVTMSFSRLKDALVVRESPGPKKVIEVHRRAIPIITLAQLNDLIVGDFTLEDLASADYPESAQAVLDAEKLQVQRHPTSSVPQEQAQEGTVGESSPGQEDDAVMAGDGHTNG